MREYRCPHGFMRSRVACEECNQAEGYKPVRTHHKGLTEEQIEKALTDAQSPADAAGRLGVSYQALQYHADRSPRLKAVVRRRLAWRRRWRRH